MHCQDPEFLSTRKFERMSIPYAVGFTEDGVRIADRQGRYRRQPLRRAGGLTNRLDRIEFFCECAGKRSVESRQGKTVMPCEGDQVMIGNL